jgi:hypothetical protein
VLLSAFAITLVIQFTDLAGVPPPVVSDTKTAVAAILADIDVIVEWVSGAGSMPTGSRVIRLTVLPHEGGALQSPSRAVMGVAARTAMGTGVAYVYYQRVLEEADRYFVPQARLLACAMAHEIGHLVQASPKHEPDGLMKAEWTAADFRRASTGRLRFTARFRTRFAPGILTSLVDN